jgi:hypothetical protein
VGWGSQHLDFTLLLRTGAGAHRLPVQGLPALQPNTDRWAIASCMNGHVGNAGRTCANVRFSEILLKNSISGRCSQRAANNDLSDRRESRDRHWGKGSRSP